MQKEQREIKKHLFICTNKKVEGECCFNKGSTEIVKTLKLKLREMDLYDDIRVTSSGCLGPCSRGVTAVLYPENEQITELEIKDVDTLIELLK